MKHFIVIYIAITVFLLVSMNSHGQNSTNYRNGSLNNYIFHVPAAWEVGDATKEQYMRKMLDLDPKYKITALSTFGVSEGAVITIYEYKLPAREYSNYIEKLYNLNVEKFKTGKRSGLVKKVFENKKIQIGGFDALLTDWKSTRGGLSHVRQWILHDSSNNEHKAVAISAFCNNRGYSAVKKEIDRIAETVHIKNMK